MKDEEEGPVLYADGGEELGGGKEPMSRIWM